MSKPLREEGGLDTLATAILSLCVLFLYLPTVTFGFSNYDDPEYVIDNPIVNAGVGHLFPGALYTRQAGNWHPLTWVSHAIDVQLFGLNAPGAHHLTNNWLHLINTILVYRVLVRLTNHRTSALFCAIGFAIHPINVESVAWISERKNLLSTLFFLISVLYYVSYARLRSGLDYAFSIVFMCLSLMSKPMLVTAPFLLLLLDYWPLQRFNCGSVHIKALLREKTPYLIASVVSGLLTLFAQRDGIASLAQASYPSRISNGIIAIIKYLKDLLFPNDLCVLYLFRPYSSGVELALSFSLLIIISVLCIVFFRKYPFILFAWFWFLIALIPVLGIVKVGEQSRADRYCYVPMIGLLIAVSKILNGRKWIRLVSGLWLLCFVPIASRQILTWQTPISLWQRVVDVDSSNEEGHRMLGVLYQERNDMRSAEEHFLKALMLNDVAPDTCLFYGRFLMKRREYSRSLIYLVKAAGLKPLDIPILETTAELYEKVGATDLCKRTYESLVALRPKDSTAIWKLVMMVFNTPEVFPSPVSSAMSYGRRLLELRGNDPMCAVVWRHCVALDGSARLDGSTSGGEKNPRLRILNEMLNESKLAKLVKANALERQTILKR